MTLVVVLRLIMMVIVDGTHTYIDIYIYRDINTKRKNYCNILVLKWMGKKEEDK